jgi:uncharacterized protein YndB with AHSA1/START domain
MAVFSMLALAGAVHADVVDSAAGGFTVRSTAVVGAPAARVYRAATREVGSWWHPDHTFSGDSGNLRIEARANGCFCEKLGKGGETRHLTVVSAEPGAMLRMTGGLGPLQELAVNGTLTLAFTEEKGRTTLELTYTVGGYRAGGLAGWAAAVDRVLADQLSRLERYVETGSPDPE